MLIRLDPVRVDGDASDVAAVTQGVIRSWNALESGLRHTAGMAGDDEGAEQWGLPYDEVAPDMNEAILSVAEVLKGFEGMLALTARTYNNVELYGAGYGDNASGIDLPADLSFHPNDIPTCIGAGAQGFLGDMQEVLEGALHSIGVTFPRGDTDKLRSAVNPWLTFAQDMTAARTQLSSALGGVQGSELSHKRSITLAANDLDQILKDLALCAVGMAGELNTIATNIDQTWHELQTMAWNLALEIAIEIGIGVALSFVTFGAGAAAAAIVVSVRVASWAVHASAVIRRLAAILRICGNRLQDFHSVLVKFRTGSFFWRAGYQAGSSSIAAIGGSFGADRIMGNEISSEQAWAYVLGGLAGGVAGGAAGAGISMLSKLPNNVGVAMGGGAVEGMAEGVIGGLTSSAILGKEFNLGQSLLTGAVGGAAVGGIGHGIETKFGTGGTGGTTGGSTGGITVDIDTPNTSVQLDLDTNGSGSGTPDLGGSGSGTGGAGGGVPTGGTSTVGDIGNVDLDGVTSTTQLDGLPTTENTTTPTPETTPEVDTNTTPEVDGTGTSIDDSGLTAPVYSAPDASVAPDVDVTVDVIPTPPHGVVPSIVDLVTTSDGPGPRKPGSESDDWVGSVTMELPTRRLPVDIDIPGLTPEHALVGTPPIDGTLSASTDGTSNFTHESSSDAGSSHADAGGRPAVGESTDGSADVAGTSEAGGGGTPDLGTAGKPDGSAAVGNLPEAPVSVGHGVDPIPNLDSIDAEFRNPMTGAVDPARMDAWAARVAEVYPTLEAKDVLGVYDYTTQSGYQAMNPYLRDLTSGLSPEATVALENRINATSDALSKLPPVDTTTYRGTGMTDALIEEFRVGETWSDKAFYSSSTDPEVAVNFQDILPNEKKVSITIEGNSGVNVGPISRYGAEAEILFQRDTVFEVVSKVFDDGVVKIVLREVAS